ncbi:MAG: lysylphosphatidylglycerol synthase transmembrane domain-containing protein [Polyangiales bacterium]
MKRLESSGGAFFTSKCFTSTSCRSRRTQVPPVFGNQSKKTSVRRFRAKRHGAYASSHREVIGWKTVRKEESNASRVLTRAGIAEASVLGTAGPRAFGEARDRRPTAGRNAEGRAPTEARDPASRPPPTCYNSAVSDTSAAKPKRNVRRIVVRTVLLLVGVGLLALFVRAAGLDEILANLRRIGWGFLWLVGISAVWRTFAVGGMWTLLDTEHRIPFLKLTAIRSAGESVNTLMPFGNVGGEPIKIMMLAREIGGTAATKYVVLDKTVFFLSGIAFMTSGTVVGAVLLADHLEVLLLTIAMLIPWTGVLAWIVWRQVKGDFVVKASRALRLLRIPLSEKTLGKLARIDGAVTESAPREPQRFAISFVLHSSAEPFAPPTCGSACGCSARASRGRAPISRPPRACWSARPSSSSPARSAPPRVATRSSSTSSVWASPRA